METPKFITAKEAAYELRIDLTHFYKCLRKGRGPPFTDAFGTIRIPYDGFQKWIENGGAPGKTNGRKGRPRKKKGNKSCSA